MNNIHTYTIKTNVKEPFYLLNVSDVHYDSKKCDRKLLKKHFDKIKELNGKIFINGDWLDVMACKHDPRSSTTDIRPEYLERGQSYLDAVIKDSYEFLSNYAENILLIGYGNHETNIIKRHEVDPLKWVVSLLNRDLEKKGSEHRIDLGAYNGAIIFYFNRSNTNIPKKIYYHHGSGGGAKRSKGILNADILVSQNTWADIITSGHDHQKWHLPFTTRDLSCNNTNWLDRKIDILRTGSYKKKSDDFGWEVEKDFNQPTLGGYLMKFELIRDFSNKKEVARVDTRIIEL